MPPFELSYQKRLWAAFTAHAIVAKHERVITELREPSNRLVSRFRRSYSFAARDRTNVGTKGTLAPLHSDFDWLIFHASERLQSLPRGFAGEGGLALRGRVGDHGKRNRSLTSKTHDPAGSQIVGSLRAWRKQGFHFRRQAPRDGSIVDFVGLRHRLIIEVDGGQHNSIPMSGAMRSVTVAWRAKVSGYCASGTRLRAAPAGSG